MMYAIKINKSGSYIIFCDEHWYETSGKEPIYTFTLEEAHAVVERMRSHYVYHLTIEGKDGSVEDINFLAPKANPMVNEVGTEKKKTLTKICARKIN